MNEKANSHALTGFILGLVSIVVWLLPLIGLPVTIVGIIFSAKGLKSTEKKGLAVTGLILSIVFIIVTIINMVIGAMMAVDVLNS